METVVVKVRGESCVLRGKSEEFWDRCGDPLRWLLAEDAVCLAQGVTCCSLAQPVTAARAAEAARAAWQRLGFVPVGSLPLRACGVFGVPCGL